MSLTDSQQEFNDDDDTVTITQDQHTHFLAL